MVTTTTLTRTTRRRERGRQWKTIFPKTIKCHTFSEPQARSDLNDDEDNDSNQWFQREVLTKTPALYQVPKLINTTTTTATCFYILTEEVPSVRNIYQYPTFWNSSINSNSKFYTILQEENHLNLLNLKYSHPSGKLNPIESLNYCNRLIFFNIFQLIRTQLQTTSNIGSNASTGRNANIGSFLLPELAVLYFEHV